MRVWISGGSGFVGSHLVRAFDDVCAPTDATRNVVAAAGDAHVVLVSTDWVFDGPAREDTPPNPIPFPIPYDTSLDARATAAVLGVELPSLDDQLLAMTEEVRP